MLHRDIRTVKQWKNLGNSLRKIYVRPYKHFRPPTDRAICMEILEEETEFFVEFPIRGRINPARAVLSVGFVLKIVFVL